MKNFSKIIVTAICAVAMIALTYGVVFLVKKLNNEKDSIVVGFVFIGDTCNPYTNNFIKAKNVLENELGDKINIKAKYNVPEGKEDIYIRELVAEKCEVIFLTSYGYGVSAKEIAKENPDIQFCALTCDNANVEPVISNYHNAMGEIYQGRYISGVVAGMKLKEMIENGLVTTDKAKVGYVGAFPYPEVVSGFTAFILGVKSIVPEATMTVVYTNSWSDYVLEKSITERLIDEGCVIISQHSDTSGPAVACEEKHDKYNVFHVGYNQSMADVAPTTSLISSKINWQYYILGVVEAVLGGKNIEKSVAGTVHGNDISAGFEQNWVQMLKLNDTIAASGTQQKIDELIEGFKDGKIRVFKGNYIGVDIFDLSATIDLNTEFIENKNSSAPEFHYLLKDIITIEE